MSDDELLAIAGRIQAEHPSIGPGELIYRTVEHAYAKAGEPRRISSRGEISN